MFKKKDKNRRRLAKVQTKHVYKKHEWGLKKKKKSSIMFCCFSYWSYLFFNLYKSLSISTLILKHHYTVVTKCHLTPCPKFPLACFYTLWKHTRNCLTKTLPPLPDPRLHRDIKNQNIYLYMINIITPSAIRSQREGCSCGDALLKY